MKFNMLQTVNTATKKVQFKAKKYSPEILVVVGAIGAVTSAVMACKATMKLEDIMETHHENVEAIHEAIEHPETLPAEYDPEKDGKKDLSIAYGRTGLALAKNYAPAVILGGLSLGALIGSNHILKKRNAALAAAYATVDSAFKKYRGNVIERFGKEVDEEMKYSIKAVEMEDDKGKKKTEKVIEEDGTTGWARFFDDGSPYWEDDSEYNLWFLRNKQAYFNDILKVKTYVFLNDVYKALGLEETKEGQVIGWVYDPDYPNGDNKIDFGIYRGDAKTRAFVNGYENHVLLDFNCDGNIYELMS